MVLLMTLLAILAGSFFWLPAFLKSNTASTTRIETLPAQAPAATLSATAAALAGADFELLDDPDAERIARDVDLYAWYASGLNATEANPSAPAPPPDNTAPETSAPDTEESGSAQ